jgi:hypothetical protein
VLGHDVASEGSTIRALVGYMLEHDFVGLVDEPAIAGQVPDRPGRVDQQGCTPRVRGSSP